MSTTLNDDREPAVVCRERGWWAGTRLVGDEGHGPTVIEITAVGECYVLAKPVMHAGKLYELPAEGMWTLCRRDWREAAATPVVEEE